MNLAVIGNIGAGKSTLCKMLAKHYNLDILKESVEDIHSWNYFMKNLKNGALNYN